MSQPVGPAGTQARTQLGAELSHWVRSCEALAQGGGEPPTLTRFQLYAGLGSLQAQARALGVQQLERPIAALTQLLEPMRPFGAAVNIGLRAILLELSQIAEQLGGSASIGPAMGRAAGPAPPPMLSMSVVMPGAGAPPPIAQPQAFGQASAQPGQVPQTPLAAPPHAPAPAAAPATNLSVRPMLGLKGFGAGGASQGSPPPGSGAAPQAGSALGLRSASGAPAAINPTAPAGHGGSVLGLRSLGASARPAPGQAPPMVSSGAPGLSAPGSLPALDPIGFGSGRPAASAPAGGEMGEMLQRLRGGHGDAAHRSSRPPPKAAKVKPKKPQGGIPGWMLLVGSVVFAALVLGIVLVVVRVKRSSDPSASASASPNASASAEAASTANSKSALPKERGLLTENEGFRALIAQVHGRGGKESPELRSLLDEEAAVSAKLVGQGKCEGGPEKCKALEKARDLFAGTAPRPIAKRTAPEGQRSRWMGGLKMPDIPVTDDDRVRRYFEYYTEGQVGRELFQSMLFRCGAYRDSIKSMLIRYELPTGVLAVVFLESGCELSAKSPVGALGLWQLMPETARAYHLRVNEELDERRSPAKSTEAAVHFLADMHQKLGSWEFVFAGYNLGPFGIVARIHRAGDNVTFWDLADNDFLPDETANYVPIIEALALILENLQRLKFAGVQIRAPENTADLEVPAGTRLGLIARAAATSVGKIRSLNPDILTGQIPTNLREKFAVQVPKDVVWQARDALQDILSRKDDADLCVPETFDWGRQRFTAEMEADCRKKLAAGQKPSASSGP